MSAYQSVMKPGRIFVIAEAGVNHNGDPETAKRLVDAAVEAHADAVKFQTFKTNKIIGKFASMADYQKENSGIDCSQFEMVKKLELPFEAFADIQNYCKKKGILFLSTPDDDESLDFLVESKVPLLKVGSTEVTNIPFLKKIGEQMLPLILSTGMSTLGEVEKAVRTIEMTGNTEITLLHCVSDYPTQPEDVNLKAMMTLREAFQYPVGFSDHTMGFEASIAAAAMGAVVLEKHFTLDHTMEGPDHKASLNPEQLKAYVQCIRNTEKLLGDGRKRPSKSELKNISNVRRSIVAARELKAGTLLENGMFELKRPGYGIQPEFLDILQGRILKRDLEEDEPIRWEDI